MNSHCTTETTRTTIPGSAFVNRPEYPEDTKSFSEKGKPLSYLACPYSHADTSVEEWRYEQATKAAAWLMNQHKLNVFSPITHSHPLHVRGDMRGDWAYWEGIDREYLSVSRELIVLLIDGWQTSTGVTSERDIARQMGIPVRFLMVISGGYSFTSEGDAYAVWMLGPPKLKKSKAFRPADIGFLQEANDLANRGSSKAPASTNPKDMIGLTKPPISLVPPAMLIHVSKVMQHGAQKYGRANWREKSVRYTVYMDAAFRHLIAAIDGEDSDPESGQPHEAHAAACMGIVLDARATGNLIDDRPKPGAAARLLAENTEKKA